MIKFYKISSVCFLLSVFLLSDVSVVLADDFVHHVIVLIDRSGSLKYREKMKDRSGSIKHQEIRRLLGATPSTSNRSGPIKYKEIPYLKKAIRTVTTKELEIICFEYGKIVEDRKLLDRTNGDYLSIITFGMEGSTEGKQKDWEAPDFKKFIHRFKDKNGEEYIYRKDFSEGMFRKGKLWDIITKKEEDKKDSFFSFNWSAISLAMPMGIHDLGEPKEDIKVHKTFLILITDENYNGGGDPIQELDKIEAAYKNSESKVQGSAEARKIYKDIRSSLFWDKVPGDNPYEKTYPDAEDDQKTTIKIKVFEFIPTAKAFAIESLIQYDVGKIDFYRVHGGFESARFDLIPINEDSPFQILKCEAKLLDTSGQIVNNNHGEYTDFTSKTPVQLRFGLNPNYYDVRDQLRFQMKFWVRWNNGVYNVHVLHPDGSPLQGAQGLNRNIKAKLEGRLKVWDIIPLQDWLYNYSTTIFHTQDQVRIKILWERISAGVVIAVIILTVLLSIFWLRKALIQKRLKDEDIEYD